MNFVDHSAPTQSDTNDPHPPATWFAAPWGRSVRVMTPITILLVLLPAISTVYVGIGSRLSSADKYVLWTTSGSLLLILMLTILFTVRGYRIENQALVILRLGWETRIPLEQLTHPIIDPTIFSNVWIRVGSGGFLGFIGWFWGRSLGWIHAWVTDPKRCVRIRRGQRWIAVSPDNPVRFISQLNSQLQQFGIPSL